MAERHDERVRAAYRAMPGDGPPPSLDAAIQAAARRAVGARPDRFRRWQVPVSIAAVIALTVGLALHVEREQPPMIADGTPVVPQTEVTASRAERAATKPAAEPSPHPEQKTGAMGSMTGTTSPLPTAKFERDALQPLEKKRMEAAAPTAAPAAVKEIAAPAIAPQSPPAFAPEPPAAPQAPPAFAPAPAAIAPPAASGSLQAAPGGAPARANFAAPAMQAAPEAPAEKGIAPRAKMEAADATSGERRVAQPVDSPEQGLEKIAQLRAKGSHDEADKALAEFRLAFPGYRISEEWLRRVERH
jgi:hypothetical protein